MAKENGFFMAAEAHASPWQSTVSHNCIHSCIQHAYMDVHITVWLEEYETSVMPAHNPWLLLNRVTVWEQWSEANLYLLIYLLFLLFSIRRCIIDIFDSQDLNSFSVILPQWLLLLELHVDS